MKPGNIPLPAKSQAAKIVGRNVEHSYNQKMNKYTGLIAAYVAQQHQLHPDVHVDSNFAVLPFIMDTAGRIHCKSMEFLEAVARRADEIHKLGYGNVLNYFKKRLSCSMARSIGHTITLRAAVVGGGLGHCAVNDFEGQVISEENGN